MNKASLILAFSFIAFSLPNVNAKSCIQSSDFYFGTVHYTHGDNSATYNFNIDTLLSTELPIITQIKYYYFGGGEHCYEHMISYLWKKNGDTVATTQIYTVTDTGLYEGEFRIAREHDDGWNYYYDTTSQYVTLHIGYISITSVNELNSSPFFSVNPSAASGVFDIHSSIPVATVRVMDATGKEVYNSRQPITTIDISDFRSGVYFYYIEDKSLHVHKGRLIKNE